MIKILIALDGSELSEQALLHAVAIGSSFESKLLLLRVISANHNGLGAHSAVDAIDWQLHRREAEAYLEQRTHELKTAGLNVSWHLEEGNVAGRLICFAQQNDIDLIILGALGHGGVGQFARGGTVQKVISVANTSVLVAAPAMEHVKHDKLTYKRIMVPVDGSRGSEWALNMATAIAEIHDAELILIQAIEKPKIFTKTPNMREKQDLMEKIIRINQTEAEDHMKELKAKLPVNLKVTTEVIVTGHVPHTINEMANLHDASLVVVSAHSDRYTSGWHYGAVPEFLLAHTNRPVLVFQHGSKQAISKFRSVHLPGNYANVS